ncbi:SRPBCC family protein [Cohnella nanjingensis]|uniref:SRPBCC domain-containing protein n=1 Tax=Cohnella nanjingensis TaxID=1387779 RepID=A0A7X0RM44_9BACL|nr:SRPBCC family protein [Cohnella nanjingensis]MBB6669876.1 SRPBCC domain-containing protein [Cohnella nanjingensis]
MTARFATHDTFVIEKTYEVAQDRVFAAWSNPKAKAKWFSPADTFEFRVGGRETSRGGPPGGPIFAFEATYQEIVPGERIVYGYTLDMDETRISASVVTVEFKPAGSGTQLIFTEQGAFLDGHDSPSQREHGTNAMLDTLGQVLQSASASGDSEI